MRITRRHRPREGILPAGDRILSFQWEQDGLDTRKESTRRSHWGSVSFSVWGRTVAVLCGLLCPNQGREQAPIANGLRDRLWESFLFEKTFVKRTRIPR